MSDRPPIQPPRIPLIPPRSQRRRTASPMAQKPGRDPERPYIDHHAGFASLAKHIRMGLDLSKPTTEVNTHQLAVILDTMIGVGLGGEAAQQFGSDLAAAHAAAVAAQSEADLAVLGGDLGTPAACTQRHYNDVDVRVEYRMCEERRGWRMAFWLLADAAP